MLQDYLPILLQVIVAFGFAIGGLVVSVLLGKAGRRNATKDSAYECGMLPEGAQQPRFSVKFYVVAMLFILFDIEVVFMYPWAVAFRDYLDKFAGLPQRFVILGSMLSFVVILLVGYFYALKKGAIDWSRKER